MGTSCLPASLPGRQRVAPSLCQLCCCCCCWFASIRPCIGDARAAAGILPVGRLACVRAPPGDAVPSIAATHACVQCDTHIHTHLSGISAVCPTYCPYIEEVQLSVRSDARSASICTRHARMPSVSSPSEDRAKGTCANDASSSSRFFLALAPRTHERPCVCQRQLRVARLLFVNVPRHACPFGVLCFVWWVPRCTLQAPTVTRKEAKQKYDYVAPSTQA